MREIAFLMRYSNGGMSFEGIMNLTFTQFFSLLDSISYWLRAETEEGQKKNSAIDKAQEYKQLKSSGELDEFKERVKKFKVKHNITSNTRIDGNKKSLGS